MLLHFQIEFHLPLGVAGVGEFLRVEVADGNAIKPHLGAICQARGVVHEGTEPDVTGREVSYAEQKYTECDRQDTGAQKDDRELTLRGPHASRLRPTPIVPPD